MSEISKQFYDFMKGLPYKDYGETRTKLCEHMGWSYWQYLRRLHGNVFLTKVTRDKIEQFFNEKIFE